MVPGEAQLQVAAAKELQDGCIRVHEDLLRGKRRSNRVPYTLHDRGPHCHAVREVVGLKCTEEVLEQRHWHGTEAGRGVWEMSLSHQVLVGAPELGPLSFKHAVELCNELVQ